MGKISKIFIIGLLLVAGLAVGWFFYFSLNFKTEPWVVEDIKQPLATTAAATASIDQVSAAVESLVASTVTTSTKVVPAPVKSAVKPSAKIIKLDVPFAVQAPFGEWEDERQQNACEEVAAVMAMAWVKGTALVPKEVRDEIIAISDWEQKEYGSYQDTSAQDTVERIFKGYFEYEKASVVNNVTIESIINELEAGHLVIAPADGQKLNNPFFTPPGPVEHMLVIIGYDYQTKEFIVNESGTKRGKNYRYNQNVLFRAIRDYPTGNHLPINGVKKNIIVVK